MHVVGVGHFTDQDHRLSRLASLLGFVGGEDYSPRRRPRRGLQTLGENPQLRLGVYVWVEDLVELVGLDAPYGLLAGD
jgi:hypothetical protein